MVKNIYKYMNFKIKLKLIILKKYVLLITDRYI